MNNSNFWIFFAIYIWFEISCWIEEPRQSLAGGDKGNLTGVAAILSHKPGNREPSEPLHCIPELNQLKSDQKRKFYRD